MMIVTLEPNINPISAGKLLDLNIYTKLTWSPYLESISKKKSASIYLLRKLKNTVVPEMIFPNSFAIL